MTGESRVVAELMRTRKVDILCVQETRWTGDKAKELGDGYKLIYSGANKEGRNGVGIILSKEKKNMITEVYRKNDRIMRVRLDSENFTANIFSVYAPQVGSTDEVKDQFWVDLQEEIEKVEQDVKCIVGGDLNGHVGGSSDVISRIHGGKTYGEGNAEGERIIDFAVSYDMTIANTFFNKPQEHLITYKSGGPFVLKK